jgi:hypothetical protein
MNPCQPHGPAPGYRKRFLASIGGPLLQQGHLQTNMFHPNKEIFLNYLIKSG